MTWQRLAVQTLAGRSRYLIGNDTPKDLAGRCRFLSKRLMGQWLLPANLPAKVPANWREGWRVVFLFRTHSAARAPLFSSAMTRSACSRKAGTAFENATPVAR